MAPRSPAQDRDGTDRPLVAVVGAGISGLVAAWRLTQAPDPPRVVVLEQSGRVGGKLLLGQVGGHELDLGAESLLARRPEGVALLHEVGLGPDVVHPATAVANVVRGRQLHPLPPGTVMGVPGRLEHLLGPLTAEEVARVAQEPALPAEPIADDVDVASWVAARLGRAVVDRLVEPLLGGVYAGHADRLSLQATVPALWEQARAGGSLLDGVRRITGRAAAVPAAPVFAGLAGGVGRLPPHLAGLLAGRGVAVRTSVAVRELHRTAGGWRLVTGPVPDERALDVDGVVLAVPPAPAARLLAGVAPAAAAELGAVETASVALVVAVLPAAALAGTPGSGLLVPPVEGRPVKAVTFSCAKWEWVADRLAGAGRGEVAVRLSLGRQGEEALLQRSDAELAALAVADLEDLLGRPLSPSATRVVRWGGGLPQYAVGHVDRVARARAAVDVLPGLAVCGAALDGVGIPACIAAAGRAAETVLAGVAAATAARAERPGRPAGVAAPGSEWVP